MSLATSFTISGSSSTIMMWAISFSEERVDAGDGVFAVPATAVHVVVADLALAIDEVGVGPALAAVAARGPAHDLSLLGRIEEDGHRRALREEAPHRRPGLVRREREHHEVVVGDHLLQRLHRG